MKGLDRILLVLGILLAIYAVISKFVGVNGISLGNFKSSNLLLAANTLLILSLIVKDYSK